VAPVLLIFLKVVLLKPDQPDRWLGYVPVTVVIFVYFCGWLLYCSDGE